MQNAGMDGSLVDSYGPISLDQSHLTRRARAWFQEAQERTREVESQTHHPTTESHDKSKEGGTEEATAKEPKSLELGETSEPEPQQEVDWTAKPGSNARAPRSKKRPSWLKEFVLAESH